MPEPTYKPEDLIVIDTIINETFSCPAKLPENLGDYLESWGAFQGVLAVLSIPIALSGGPSPLAIGAGLGLNALASSLISSGSLDDIHNAQAKFRGLRYKDYPNCPIQINLRTQVTVLKRGDGSLDVVLNNNVTYSTAYNIIAPKDGDGASQASLYRDIALFAVYPQEPSSIKPGEMQPNTAIDQANYNYQVTWSVGAGISGEASLEVGKSDPKGSGKVGFNANGSYTFSNGAEVSRKDFDVAKQSFGNGVVWKSELQNVYENYNTQALPYSPQNPGTIIRHSGATTWISGPPKSATADLNLAFLSTFNVPASAVNHSVIKLNIAASQQLQHAVSMGRWGAPNARVGGAPAIIPASFEAIGTLIIDLNAKTVAIANDSAVFKTMFDKFAEIEALKQAVEKQKATGAIK